MPLTARSSSPFAPYCRLQVHRAVYKGTPVAVKVQRAGLKELFDTDLKNLKVLAKLLDKFDPKSDGADRSYADIYDESSKLLYEEIDYTLEGKNAQVRTRTRPAQGLRLRSTRPHATPRSLLSAILPPPTRARGAAL